jgi:hypothetical protein
MYIVYIQFGHSLNLKNLKTLVSPDWKWWVQDSSRWVVRLSASTVWWEFSNVVHWKINILFVDSKKDTIDYNIGLMSTLRKICWWYLYKKNLKNVQIVYIQCTSSLSLTTHLDESWTHHFQSGLTNVFKFFILTMVGLTKIFKNVLSTHQNKMSPVCLRYISGLIHYSMSEIYIWSYSLLNHGVFKL